MFHYYQVMVAWKAPLTWYNRVILTDFCRWKQRRLLLLPSSKLNITLFPLIVYFTHVWARQLLENVINCDLE